MAKRVLAHCWPGSLASAAGEWVGGHQQRYPERSESLGLQGEDTSEGRSDGSHLASRGCGVSLRTGDHRSLLKAQRASGRSRAVRQTFRALRGVGWGEAGSRQSAGNELASLLADWRLSARIKRQAPVVGSARQGLAGQGEKALRG